VQIAWDHGDLVHAEELAKECSALFEACGDGEGVAGTYLMLAGLARDRRHPEDAIPLYEQSLTGFRAVGQRWGEAEAARHFGTLLLAVGDVERAERLGWESLRTCQELAIGRGTGQSLELLARVAHEQGQLEAAAALCQGALTSLRSEGYPADVAGTVVTAAHIELHRGHLDRAEALVAEAVGPVQGFGYRRQRSPALALLARIRARQGDPSAAPLARAALETAHAEGDRRAEASALESLAEADLAMGNVADAVRSAEAALAIGRALGLRPSHIEEVDRDAVTQALKRQELVIDLRSAAEPADTWDGSERRRVERRRTEGAVEVAPGGAGRSFDAERAREERRGSGRRRIDRLP
jgi:tetratricopeptide (TPR) repeat protein